MKYVLSMLGMASVALAVAGGIIMLEERERAMPQTIVVEPSTDSLGVVADLRGLPGCRQAESSVTSDGKEVVLASFVNRGAVVAWIEGALRQRLGKGLTAEQAEALVNAVPSHEGPVMAVATIVRQGLPRFMLARGATPPIDISVEYYEPLAAPSVALAAPLDRAARGS